jgi:hypothetical protein
MANESAATAPRGTSYVEWGAVFAGAILAAALSFVLLAAGAAIGLSLVSPYSSQSFGKWAATLATSWALMTTIGSFLVGGYVAGRMRSVWGDANADEVIFRDGIHGVLVWSLSILLGATVAAIAATPATLVGADVGRSVVYASRSGSALVPTVDDLLRGGAGANAAAAQTTSTDMRDDVTRLLAAAVAGGQLSDVNRNYLTQLVSQRTGLASAEAEKRVAEAYATAARAIDDARRAAVLVGLVTATALLIGLAASWYAAQRGGHQRDHNIPAKFGAFRRRQA